MITREPAQETLDADWDAAWRQRKKLLLIRVVAGEPQAEF
jgi:hypothetical protein